MILSLRKRHLQAWILIALLLIIMVPLSVVYIPEVPTQESGEIQFSENNVIQSVEEEGYKVEVAEGNEDYLLKLEVKESFKTPAPTIFVRINGEERKMNNAGAGIYMERFDKSNGSIQQIEIRDDLESELYYTINLH